MVLKGVNWGGVHDLEKSQLMPVQYEYWYHIKLDCRLM